jgi:ABC-type nitrate/sulfonate/bicarbonate transport system substrate-binding protein
MSTTIKIGGVPEHFNLPIILAIERGAFAEHDIDLPVDVLSPVARGL